MKKLILFAGLLFCSLTQAQQSAITVNKTGGGTINNGDVFTYNTLSESQAKLKFTVTNNTTETLNIRVRVDEINNASGGQVQLCFGVCVYQLTEQLSVPNAGVEVQPGETTPSPDDHFWNANPGTNTAEPVTYKLTFESVNNGTVTDLISFTYIYSATAGTSDFISLKNIGITVNNTVIKDNLNVTTTQKAKMEVYNITGQVVKTVAVQAGTQAINMTDLNAAPYIVRFTNDKNQASQIKVVKQ